MLTDEQAFIYTVICQINKFQFDDLVKTIISHLH